MLDSTLTFCTVAKQKKNTQPKTLLTHSYNFLIEFKRLYCSETLKGVVAIFIDSFLQNKTKTLINTALKPYETDKPRQML